VQGVLERSVRKTMPIVILAKSNKVKDRLLWTGGLSGKFSVHRGADCLRIFCFLSLDFHRRSFALSQYVSIVGRKGCP
jgi:hypothetical protein